HEWEARYIDIQAGRGCPTCVDIVNGARVSKLQRQLCDMLDGRINVACGPYRIDVAKEINGEKIAIEYDSWYWHGGREDRDRTRADYLMVKGWRVLRILSNKTLPTLDVIESEIDKLIAGSSLVNLVLSDWGEGPTRAIDDASGSSA
ncbi:DUF559 domain-containing protein, partial [Candidatus Bipolaricaulota bacterium]|nr:DUF559 domain-containing protein [Candidatus Bipolaricaulota bacterium]